METEKRKRIIKNVTKLVSETNFDDLITACLEHGILTKRMYIFLMLKSKEERHEQLFIKITQRGPTAYEKLIKILTDLNRTRALNILNESNHVSENKINRNDDPQIERIERTITESRPVKTHGCKPFKDDDDEDLKFQEHIGLKPYTKDIQPLNDYYTVIPSSEIHIDDKVGTYKMTSRYNRGIFLMVNIIDFPNIKRRRNGAEKDSQSLLYLFKNLGFTLFAYNNLSHEEFFNVLKMLMESDYTKRTECFVMALMTHGSLLNNSVQQVEFHDGKFANVSNIESYFTNNECKNLVNKPKILLFPFCRGDYSDLGTYVQTDGVLELPMPKHITHSRSDILICYASTQGCHTHREVDNGSWYIQIFCKIMAKYAHNTDFDDIVKMVQEKVALLRTESGTMQMGTHENNGFNKKLYFNPGVWLDENNQLHRIPITLTENTTASK